MKNRFAKALTSTITVIILIITVFFFNDAVSAVASSNNSCGENASYTFDSEKGLLTVQGTGSMENYFVNSDSENGSQNPPWYTIRNEIKSVKINDGITDVGQFAFFDCKNLKKVEIADSVKSIGSWAFCNCINLNKVAFSPNVTSIDEGAFENTGFYNNKDNWDNRTLYLNGFLVSLGSSFKGDFIIKRGTNGIASKAFNDCPELTSVTVPESVKYTSGVMFVSCPKLKNVKFLGNELKYDEYFILFKSDRPTVECIKNSDIYKYAVEKGLKLSLIVKNSESVTTINETSASSEQVSETVSAKVTVTIPETEKVNTELKSETPHGSRSNKPIWIAAAVFVICILLVITIIPFSGIYIKIPFSGIYIKVHALYASKNFRPAEPSLYSEKYIVNIAKAQIGRNGADLGYKTEWCAAFICDCATIAGQKDTIIGNDPSEIGTTSLYKMMKEAGGKEIAKSEAKEGDIAFINWKGDSSIAHVEFIVSNENGDIRTVGGNTGNGSTRNSRIVRLLDYNASKYIIHVIRPNYKPNPLQKIYNSKNQTFLFQHKSTGNANSAGSMYITADNQAAYAVLEETGTKEMSIKPFLHFETYTFKMKVGKISFSNINHLKIDINLIPKDFRNNFKWTNSKSTVYYKRYGDFILLFNSEKSRDADDCKNYILGKIHFNSGGQTIKNICKIDSLRYATDKWISVANSNTPTYSMIKEATKTVQGGLGVYLKTGDGIVNISSSIFGCKT